jgi:hypothetical protein
MHGRNPRPYWSMPSSGEREKREEKEREKETRGLQLRWLASSFHTNIFPHSWELLGILPSDDSVKFRTVNWCKSIIASSSIQ